MKKESADEKYFSPDEIAQTFLLDYLYDPEQEKPLNRESLKRGRYTLAFWRNDFYQWDAGRWMRINDSEIDLGITKHLQQHNETYEVFIQNEPRVSIHKNLVGNIRLCLAARVLRPWA